MPFNNNSPFGGSVSNSAADTVITQAGHSFTPGDWLAIFGNSYIKAKADNIDTAEVVARVVSAPSIDTFLINRNGSYLTGLAGLTPGPYYLSATVAGAMTTVAPTLAGHINKPVFVADTATSGYVILLRGFAITG